MVHEVLEPSMVQKVNPGESGPVPAVPGFLIINADDFGRVTPTTDRILECSAVGAVSSVSAMVFMEDSERAAAIARERGIEAGLHLNFTSPFSASNCPPKLMEHQPKTARYLMRHRLAQMVFHPALMGSFNYLVAAQLDEFRRIYGSAPAKIDGHHHMHLCANVRIQKLLPVGTLVRRNFSFDRGEKSAWNRWYRKSVDRGLARRHRLTDYFFSLPPMQPGRLKRIYSLASRSIVELETHPVQSEEYRYLTEGDLFREIGETRMAAPSAVAHCKSGTNLC